jgi:ATP-dependent Clp protease ATP-binding subunit ClpA
MWQLFNEPARKTIFYAQEEAIRHGQSQVSTEHILLGLLRNECAATEVLHQLDIRTSQIKTDVERQAARGSSRMGQDLELGPRSKRVVDLAYEESRHVDDSFIGTEHLLLALIHEAEGLGGSVLLNLGADLEQVRKEVRAQQHRKKLSDPNGPKPKTEAEHALQAIDLALLQPALSKKAIEVKIEPKADLVTISHLIDSTWQEFISIPINAHKALLDCCKLAAGLDILLQEQQQGEVTVRYGDKERTFIVATDPSEHGETVALSAILEITRTVVP